MNKKDKFDNGISPVLNDDALESVSGGTKTNKNNYNHYFSPLPAQPDSAPAVPPLLLHPDPRPEEEKNADIADRV